MNNLYIDGDGCRADIRILAEKWAERGVNVVIVSDRPIHCENDYTQMVVCAVGENASDRYIEARVRNKDAVITRDLQLAKHLLARRDVELVVCSDQGEIYSKDIIDARITRSQHAKQRREESEAQKKLSRSKKEQIKRQQKEKVAHILEQWRLSVAP